MGEKKKSENDKYNSSKIYPANRCITVMSGPLTDKCRVARPPAKDPANALAPPGPMEFPLRYSVFKERFEERLLAKLAAPWSAMPLKPKFFSGGKGSRYGGGWGCGHAALYSIILMSWLPSLPSLFLLLIVTAES